MAETKKTPDFTITVQTIFPYKLLPYFVDKHLDNLYLGFALNKKHPIKKGLESIYTGIGDSFNTKYKSELFYLELKYNAEGILRIHNRLLKNPEDIGIVVAQYVNNIADAGILIGEECDPKLIRERIERSISGAEHIIKQINQGIDYELPIACLLKQGIEHLAELTETNEEFKECSEILNKIKKGYDYRSKIHSRICTTKPKIQNGPEVGLHCYIIPRSWVYQNK
jgi:hypothetical protein